MFGNFSINEVHLYILSWLDRKSSKESFDRIKNSIGMVGVLNTLATSDPKQAFDASMKMMDIESKSSTEAGIIKTTMPHQTTEEYKASLDKITLDLSRTEK